MNLRQRLATLRAESGGGAGCAEAAPPGEPGQLAAHLARLRARRPGPACGGEDGGEGRGGRGCDTEELAARLGGKVTAPGLIVIERRLPVGECHGALPLGAALAPGDHLPEGRGIDPRRLVFFDTETSGLAGGAGTVVFLLGMGRFEAGEFVVRQQLLTTFSGEAALLDDAAAWLGEGAVLASFNGRSFDAPLLAARHRLRGRADPFAACPHLDLLHPTRRAFGRRWEDTRLATAERRLLGFRRHDDTPGAEAPLAWFDLVRRGDARRIPGIVRHNYWDVLSLVVLLARLEAVHRAPLAHGADPLGIARALFKRGEEGRGYRLLRAAEGALDAAGLLELARRHRRRGRWEAARLIWERLAEAGEAGEAEALEALAKYHEHRGGDVLRARDYAGRLPVCAASRRRLARLERRIDGAGGQLTLPLDAR